VEVHSSARKHGISDDDIAHSVEHALVEYEFGGDDSASRTLVLGPDRAGNMLEVIVLVFDDGREMAIHAMPMRRIYDDLIPEGGGATR